MPKLEDLDQFKSVINSLSNEASWREQRGEELQNLEVSDPVLPQVEEDPLDAPALETPSPPLNVDDTSNVDEPIEEPSLNEPVVAEEPAPPLNNDDSPTDEVEQEEPEQPAELEPIDDELPLVDDLELDDSAFTGSMGDIFSDSLHLDDDETEPKKEAINIDNDNSSFAGGVHDALDDDDGTEPEFNMDDFAGIFNEKSAKTSAKKSEEEPEEPDDDEGPLFFTIHQVEQIRTHLNNMPRNLKMALQDILSNEEIDEEVVRSLTKKILKHASAYNLAQEVNKITGSTIVVPRFYQKNTGNAFEKRSKGLAYIFMHQQWPRLRHFIVVVTGFWLAVLMLFHFAYRPIRATVYYKQGLAYIEENKNDEAEASFNKAFVGWPLSFGSLQLNVKGWRSQNWFYRYANAYLKQRQFNLAEQKYIALIANYPKSERAFLAYGQFENARTLYPQADAIYDQFLNTINKQNFRIMLAKGDNLMDWGENLDPDQFREANRIYSDLQRIFGERPELNLRFLNYAVKTDNEKMIKIYYHHYISHPKLAADADIFAGLAGWLLDHGQENEALAILRRAMGANPHSIAVHYQLARYFGYVDEPVAQLEALNAARTYLKNLETLSRTQLEISIDIYRRVAMLEGRKGNFNTAEIAYLEAIKQYEASVARGVFTPEAKFGELYAQLGLLYLKQSKANRQAAALYLDKALANNFDSTELRFYRALIAYYTDDYTTALLDFYRTYEQEPYNYNVLFSLATVLAKRQSNASAQAIYLQLITLLEKDRMAYNANPNSADAQVLSIFLTKSYNNLAIVLYYLSQEGHNVDRYLQESYKAFEEANKAWDYLTRDSRTLIRSTERGLAFDNQAVVNGTNRRQTSLMLYDDLPAQLFGPDYNWATR